MMTNPMNNQVQRYLYNHIVGATSVDYQVSSKDLKMNRVNRTFIYNFKIQIANDNEFVLACASDEDR